MSTFPLPCGPRKRKKKPKTAQSSTSSMAAGTSSDPGMSTSPVMSPLTFIKRQGFAKIDGQQFEWNLAALLFLRGLNSDTDFELATNVDGAGAVDDVVFRFKSSGESDTWTTVFIQLKHKETGTVSRKLLKNSKEGFDLAKYFKSYLEIKQAMSGAEKGTLFDGSFEKSVFLIFTNAKAKQSLGEGRCETLSQAEEFVWCGVGQVFNFKDDQEILECLSEYGDEGNMFLGRLQLFCGQPNAHGLEAAVEKELHKVDGQIIESVDFKSLLDSFLRHMKVWWETSSEVLHRGNDILRSAILEVTSQQTEKRYSLDLAFEEAILETFRDSFKGNFKIFTIKSSESSCRLSLTKLCQAFEGQSLVLDCAGLLANRGALLSQCRKGQVKGVIICTNDWSSSHQEDYFNVIQDLLAFPNTPPIAFLSNDKSCAVEALKIKFQESTKSCEDDFLFSQLNEAFREKVFAKEVSLQGHSTTLSVLLKDTPGSADRVLDAFSVVEILGCSGSLKLGSAFGEGIGHYVDRYLELPNVVKTSIFQDDSLKETVTVRVMQCEVSDLTTNLGLGHDIGLDEGFAGETSEFFRVLSTKKPGLFGKAVSILSTLSDKVNVDQILSNLSESLLIPDTGDSEVFIGPKFPLGLFECNSVGLRFGQHDAVTALWVCTNKHSLQTGFLFVSDKTSEDDVRKLTDFHQSKHLLSLDDGQLRWIQSQGDIETIRPYIDEKQAPKFAPENAMDVEDRLVLVCAEPGMGKTTLMARLAKNTKEAHPRHFVFLIALSDHFQVFAQEGHKDALGFLCSTNKIESHLHRSLLKYALEVSGDVVVLFDGYDEISPKYIEQSCELLSSLIKETKASKIWMTSRNSVKLTLEAKTAKFSANICEFNRKDQENFLRKFLAGKSRLLQEEFDLFINQLIDKASQAVRDKGSNFMGVPLQIQMLAEVYEHRVTGSADKTELPEKLDLLVLLEQFVDKKLSVYVQARLKLPLENPQYESHLKRSRESFVENHGKAALILFLSVDDIKILGMQSLITESSEFFNEIQNGSLASGFIDSIVNDKPHFVHRVFAEYFVAKWISKYFGNHRELVRSKLFSADFALVRNLFDRILTKGCDLPAAVVSKDLEKVRTLLELEGVDVDAKDKGGRTALHLAAGLGTSQDREANTCCGEILDLLIGKTNNFNQVDDVLGGSPLTYADVTRSWVAIDKFIPCIENKKHFALTLQDVTEGGKLNVVFDLDLHNIMGLCLDNGLDVEHCSEGKRRLLFLACELGSVKVATLLIKRNANINAVEKQYSPLLHRKIDYRYDSLLHVASANGHIDILELLIEHQQQLKMVTNINIVDVNGWTPIHLAARYGQSGVISFLVHRGGDLRCRSNHNSTPLHFAAEFKHPDAVRVLLEALDETDRADAINLCDNDGDSVLMCGASGGCVDCVQQLVTNGARLTETNNLKRTPLMGAASEGHLEIGKYLLTNFNEEKEGMMLKDYISMMDEDEGAALELAVVCDHPEFASFIITKSSGLDTSDHRYISLLRYAARLNYPDTLRVLLEAMDENDRPAAINTYDKTSVFTQGILGGSKECVDLLVKAGGKLSQETPNGDTPLMIALAHGHQEVVNYLLNNFDAEMEGMSLSQYLNVKSNDSWTAVSLAAHCGNADAISSLVSLGGDPLSRNIYNCSPLHMVAKRKYSGALKVLLEVIDEAGRPAAVNQADKNGESVLMYGAFGGCVECISMIDKYGGKMAQVSNNGSTALIIAAEKGHLEVVSYLLHNFKADREGMSLQEYIHMTDEVGLAAIHMAALEGHTGIIKILVNEGCDPIIRTNKNRTPLHLAVEYKHPDAVRVLLETMDEADRAAAVNSCDHEEFSVLMVGAFKGCLECVHLIVQAGGKMTQADNDGITSLILAVLKDQQEVVNYLLENFNPERDGMTRVDFINMRTKCGSSALEFAKQNGHAEILQSLLSATSDKKSCCECCQLL